MPGRPVPPATEPSAATCGVQVTTPRHTGLKSLNADKTFAPVQQHRYMASYHLLPKQYPIGLGVSECLPCCLLIASITWGQGQTSHHSVTDTCQMGARARACVVGSVFQDRPGGCRGPRWRCPPRGRRRARYPCGQPGSRARWATLESDSGIISPP